MEAVAKRARVTRITIYHQFASKAHLLEAVFDEFAVVGGLAALPKVFAERDPRRALHEMVRVFLTFWANHRRMLPRLSAALVDADIVKGLQARMERRRAGLGVIVGRLVGPTADRARADDLVDVLYALTSYEMFELLSTRDRQVPEIEALVIKTVDAALEFSGLLP
jgi:AcrR family transcriptional regulator